MKALLDEVKASRDDLRRECEGWKEQAQRLALAAPIATPPVPAAIPPAPTPSAPTPRPAPVMVEAAGGLTDQGLEISPASLTEAHPALACRDLHQQVGQGDVGAPKRAIGSDRGQGTADCPSVPRRGALYSSLKGTWRMKPARRSASLAVKSAGSLIVTR